jgi:hypothetical protein
MEKFPVIFTIVFEEQSCGIRIATGLINPARERNGDTKVAMTEKKMNKIFNGNGRNKVNISSPS